jgi:uncharacterized membrane protein
MRLDRPLVVLNKLTPALIFLIVNTAIDFATAFGWISLQQEQKDQITNALNVLTLLLVTYGIISATNNVTPVSDPQLPAGTTVKVTTPDNVPTHTETLGS